MRYLSIIQISIAISFSPLATAELTLPSFFSSGMVLQREIGAPVWGGAEPNQEVTLTFDECVYKTVADSQGAWNIVLNGLEASFEGKPLMVKSGETEIILNDVLIGEVWVASGQSNMEWTMEQAKYVPKNRYDNTAIRQFSGPNRSNSVPQNDYKGEWKAAVGREVNRFSAVAYHFAEHLQSELDTPVGILELAWGGRPIQSFVRREALEELPEGEIYLKRQLKHLPAYERSLKPEWQQGFQSRLDHYKKSLAEWKLNGKEGKRPVEPVRPVNPMSDASYASSIYNGMIHPMTRYGIRGAIWYQGESNVGGAEAAIYGELLDTMVKDWRSQWGRQFSFYWAQLTSNRTQSDNPNKGGGWPRLQDEQRRALNTIPHSGMAVITDIGDAHNIHPYNKKDVGYRLALWALYHDYGQENIHYTGPLYKSARFDGENVIVSFDYSEGLTSMDGQPLRHFALAGDDGVWYWADAVIDGKSVVVKCAEVKNPSKVRFAWLRNAEGVNLTNHSGLPASCFSSEFDE